MSLPLLEALLLRFLAEGGPITDQDNFFEKAVESALDKLLPVDANSGNAEKNREDREKLKKDLLLKNFRLLLWQEYLNILL